MMPVRFRIVALLVVAAQSQSAFATFGIVSVSGGIQTTAPASVVSGATENPLPIIFPEAIGKTLLAPLPVDHDGSDVVAPGPAINANSVVNSAYIAAMLQPGTVVNSYLFHFDRPSTPPTAPFYITTINFVGHVVGVQMFSNGYLTLQKPFGTPYVGTLETGDLAFGAGTIYPTGSASRGLDEDEFSLSISGSQVVLTGIALGTQIDQVRIITAVPEPNAIAIWTMMSLTCAGLVWHLRRAKY